MLCFLRDLANSEWDDIKTRLASGEFPCDLEYVESNGESFEDLAKRTEGYFVVGNQRTFRDHAMWVIDCESLSKFRAHVDHIWAPVSNLPIGNMDWDEFKSAVCADGIYRGHDAEQ